MVRIRGWLETQSGTWQREEALWIGHCLSLPSGLAQMLGCSRLSDWWLVGEPLTMVYVRVSLGNQSLTKYGDPNMTHGSNSAHFLCTAPAPYNDMNYL
jgi:hypothetical protein